MTLNNPILYAALFLFSAIQPSLAEDNIDTVMARMRPEIAVKIAYQEIRYMGLLEDDWQGSGFLYAAPPNTLLKQQLKPYIETMAAEGRQLTYVKPDTQTFHQLQLDESNSMMASLAVFQGIMMGNLQYLRNSYQLKFTQLESGWKLVMIAKEHEPDEEPIKIILQGLQQQAATQLELILPDGDRNAYVLQSAQQGVDIKQQMLGVLQGLRVK